MIVSNIGRPISERPWCYHKRGISLDDNLGPDNQITNYNENCINANENDNNSFIIASVKGDERISNMDAADDDNNDSSESLVDRFGKILSCEDMADIHFIVGSANTKKLLRIPAHKLVLSVASPVFKDMFYGQCCSSGQDCSDRESNVNDNVNNDNVDNNVDVYDNDNNKNRNEEQLNKTLDEIVKDIELPDIEPIVFLELLRYLYTDQVKMTRDNIIPLLNSTKRFEIVGLEKRCYQYLKYSINEKNALVIWLGCKEYGEAKLEQYCLKVIEKNAHYVFLSSDFLRLDYETMCFLLRNDLLRIDEVNIFRGVARWAKNQCLRKGVCPTRHNIREVLGDAISLIRFPLMTEEQLNRNVASEGILEDDVMQTLLRYFKTWPRMDNPLLFSNSPRAYQRLQNNLQIIQRFTSYDNQLTNRFTTHQLTFSVSHRIFLAGIGIYGPKKACTFYLQASFVIIKSGSTNSSTKFPNFIADQAEKSILIKCDGTSPIINIKLDDPFEVEPETCYEITAKISPTMRSTSIVRSKFNPLLYYTKAQEVNYYYGVGGQRLVEVKMPKDSNATSSDCSITKPSTSSSNRNESILFSFSWNNFSDDELMNETSGLPSISVPGTPNPPPPRPPLPKEYRRPSTLAKLKRALSFTGSSSKDAQPKHQDRINMLQGQIPVIMFYA